MALPLIPYIRQSRAKEQTISLEVQREAIVAWAKPNDVPLAAEVVEQGVSGSKRWQDRELGAAIEAVQEKRAAGLIVAFQDRLSREQALGTAEIWEALESVKARLVCAAEGLDTGRGSSDDRMLFSIKAAIHRHAWERYQANWAKAVSKGVGAGRYVGPLPVGYDRVDGLVRGEAQSVMPGAKDGRLVKNQHAPAIEHAFRMRATGASWSEVVRYLGGAGVPTATGMSEWSVSGARSMFQNPIYKGQLKNGHTHYFPEYAVIEPSVWDRVNPNGPRVDRERRARWTYTYDVKQGIIRTEIERERRPGSKAGGRQDAGEWAVLGGLLKCGCCGHRMKPHTSKPGHSYYICGYLHCTERARIRPDEIEPLVTDAAFAYFAAYVEQQGLGKDADTGRVAQLEIERDDAARRLEKFIRVASLDDDGYEARLTELREAKQTAQQAITEEQAATRRFPSAEEVQVIIETGTVAEKRQVIRLALHEIIVWKKGTEPKPQGAGGDRLDATEEYAGRVEVNWRMPEVAA